MAGLVLSAEQIRNVPPGVRPWLKSIADANSQQHSDAGLDRTEAVLLGCTSAEATEVLTRIRYLAAQVMVEGAMSYSSHRRKPR